MKTLNKLLAIGAMAFLLMLMAPSKSKAQDDGYVSDQQFYDELQQYGTWVQDDQYGDVWVPDVDEDFRPYATNGYWVQTDYGSTWVSDYPWGWATFHYGRWRYDDYYGWEWIPGHEWAPAWVSWRQGGGYYGWAPMGPGISITLSLGGVGLNINNDYWVYAPQRYITSRYINRYYAPRTQISIIIRKTTYIHNTYVYNKRTYITGPRPRDIQKITRQKVTVYKINNATKPGAFHTDKTVINIYRPQVKKSPDARPVRVVSATAYKNEHPTEGIGKKGATGYNRGNAAKLAAIARSNNPNSNVVKVNPKKPGANKPEPNKPNEPNKANEPNKPNEPAVNHPGAKGGHKTAEPNSNNPAQPTEAKGGKGHHKPAPATTPPAGQQPAANKPAEQPASNAPTQPATTPAAGSNGHHRKATPAVVPAEQHNTDQAQQQAAEQQKQALQAARQQQQQQQQAAKQQAQQAAREQQQQAKQQAQQQQKQQQQQAQQAARQQQQQQQQAAKQAAQQAKQQQQQQARQAAQQAQQEKKQQEEQQKKQEQTPPLK